MKRSHIAICAFLAVSSFASTAQTNYFGDRGEDIPRPQQPVMKHEFAEVGSARALDKVSREMRTMVARQCSQILL